MNAEIKEVGFLLTFALLFGFGYFSVSFDDLAFTQPAPPYRYLMQEAQAEVFNPNSLFYPWVSSVGEIEPLELPSVESNPLENNFLNDIFKTFETHESHDIPIPNTSRVLLLQTGSFMPLSWGEVSYFTKQQMDQIEGKRFDPLSYFFRIFLPEADADTFPFTIGSFNRVRTGNLISTSCSTVGITNTPGALLSYTVDTANAECWLTIAYWSIAGIPDQSTVTDVRFELSSGFISTGERTCDIIQMSIDNPASASAQDALDDLFNGTSYGTLPSCGFAASNFSLDLGAQGDTDVTNKLDTNTFSVGIINSPNTRDALIHLTDLQDPELRVLFNPPADVWDFREHDDNPSLDPVMTPLMEGVGADRAELSSTAGSVGDGYIFKSFDKADIIGSDISVTWEKVSSGSPGPLTISTTQSLSQVSRETGQLGTVCGAVFAFTTASPVEAIGKTPTSSASECGTRAFYEFNTSIIPDGSTITDVDLIIHPQFTGTAATEDCEIRAMELQPSLQTIQNKFDDIANGTIYNPTAGAWCRFTGVAGQEIDLGITADSDLQSQLTGNWFAVGRKYIDETRDASTHSTTRWTSVALRVTYTPPAGSTTMGLEVVDGFYDMESLTDFPSNGPRAVKGAGVLGSLSYSGTGSQTDTLSAGSINYGSSTQSSITVFLKLGDDSFETTDAFFNSIDISQIGNYTFTGGDPNILLKPGTTSDYGLYEPSSLTSATVPETITDLEVFPVENSIFMNWTEPMGSPTFYLIERADGDISRLGSDDFIMYFQDRDSIAPDTVYGTGTEFAFGSEIPISDPKNVTEIDVSMIRAAGVCAGSGVLRGSIWSTSGSVLFGSSNATISGCSLETTFTNQNLVTERFFFDPPLQLSAGTYVFGVNMTGTIDKSVTVARQDSGLSAVIVPKSSPTDTFPYTFATLIGDFGMNVRVEDFSLIAKVSSSQTNFTDSSVTEMNSTWKWREHDDTAFTPVFTFFGGSNINIDSTGGSRGTGYVMKTFEKEDIFGSDISIDWDLSFNIGMTIGMEVLDGAYDANSLTDFPNNAVRISKGAGVLGSHFLSNEPTTPTVTTLNASQINYGASTLPQITVLISLIDPSQAANFGNLDIRSINITKSASFDFTPTTKVDVVTATNNDNGEYTDNSITFTNLIDGISYFYRVRGENNIGVAVNGSNIAVTKEPVLDDGQSPIINSTSSRWYYREVDNFVCYDQGSGCRTAILFTPNSGVFPVGWMRIQSVIGVGSNSLGQGVIMKSFNKTEVFGSDFTVNWSTQRLDPGSGTMYFRLYDGAYNVENHPDFPIDSGIQTIGGGILGSTSIVLGPDFTDTFTTLTNGSISWGSSTEDFVTLMMIQEDPGGFLRLDTQINNVTITNLGTWQFTGEPTTVTHLENQFESHLQYDSWDSGYFEEGTFASLVLPDAPAVVNATADIDTVIVDWDAVVADPEVDRYWVERGFDFNGTWQYREMNYASFGSTPNCDWDSLSDGIRMEMQGSSTASDGCTLFKILPTGLINNTKVKIDWTGSDTGAGSPLTSRVKYGNVAVFRDPSTTLPVLHSTDGIAGGDFNQAPFGEALDTHLFKSNDGGWTRVIDTYSPSLSQFDTETENPFTTLAIIIEDITIINNPITVIHSINITDSTTNETIAFWNFSSPTQNIENTGSCLSDLTPATCDFGTIEAGSTSGESFEVIGNTDDLNQVWQDEFSTYPDNATANLSWENANCQTDSNGGDDYCGVNSTSDSIRTHWGNRQNNGLSYDLFSNLGINATDSNGDGQFSLLWKSTLLDPEGAGGNNWIIGISDKDYNFGTLSLQDFLGTRIIENAGFGTNNQFTTLLSDNENTATFTDIDTNIGGQGVYDSTGIPRYFNATFTGSNLIVSIHSCEARNLGCFLDSLTSSAGAEVYRDLRYIKIQPLDSGSDTQDFLFDYDNFILQVDGQDPVTIFVDTTQERGIDYTYGVFAENAVGNGTVTESNLVLTNDVPDQVQNLAFDNSTSGQIDIQWDDLAFNSGEGNPSTGLNLTKYEIYRNNVTGGGGFFLLASNLASSPPENFYNDTDIIDGDEYEYQVVGCNAIDCGDNSTSVTLFAPSGSPPNAPTGFAGIANNTDITLSWNNQTDKDYWDLDRNGTNIVTGLTNLTYNDPNVTPGTNFGYVLTAVNGTGSNSTAEIVILSNDVPSAVTGLGTMPIDGEAILVEWDDPVAFRGEGNPTTGVNVTYTVFRQDNTIAGNFVFVATVPEGTDFYNDTGVLGGHTYTYKILSANAVGNAAANSTASTPVMVANALVITAYESDGVTDLDGSITITVFNSTFTDTKTGDGQGRASFPDLSGDYDFTIFHISTAFIINKTTSSVTVPFDEDVVIDVTTDVHRVNCPSNGPGNDLLVLVNSSSADHYISPFTDPVCDAQDKVSWDVLFVGLGGGGNATTREGNAVLGISYFDSPLSFANTNVEEADIIDDIASDGHFKVGNYVNLEGQKIKSVTFWGISYPSPTTFGNITAYIWDDIVPSGVTSDGDQTIIATSDTYDFTATTESGNFPPSLAGDFHKVFTLNFSSPIELTGQYVLGIEVYANPFGSFILSVGDAATIQDGNSIFGFDPADPEKGCQITSSDTSDSWVDCSNTFGPGSLDALAMQVDIEEEVDQLSSSGGVEPTKLVVYQTFDSTEVDGGIGVNAGTLNEFGDVSNLVDIPSTEGNELTGLHYVPTIDGAFHHLSAADDDYAKGSLALNAGTLGNSADGSYITDDDSGEGLDVVDFYQQSLYEVTGNSNSALTTTGQAFALGTAETQMRLGSFDDRSQWDFFIDDVTDKWSMSFWVDSNNFGAVTTVSPIMASTAGGRGILVGAQGDGAGGWEPYLQVEAENGGQTIDILYDTPSGAIAGGGYQLVTISVEKSNATDTAKICINGSSNCDTNDRLLDFDPLTGFSDYPLTIGIGNDDVLDALPDPASFTDFVIDDVCIWKDVVLTSSQIDTLYNSGDGQPCATVVQNGRTQTESTLMTNLIFGSALDDAEDIFTNIGSTGKIGNIIQLREQKVTSVTVEFGDLDTQTPGSGNITAYIWKNITPDGATTSDGNEQILATSNTFIFDGLTEQEVTFNFTSAPTLGVASGAGSDYVIGFEWIGADNQLDLRGYITSLYDGNSVFSSSGIECTWVSGGNWDDCNNLTTQLFSIKMEIQTEEFVRNVGVSSGIETSDLVAYYTFDGDDDFYIGDWYLTDFILNSSSIIGDGALNARDNNAMQFGHYGNKDNWTFLHDETTDYSISFWLKGDMDKEDPISILNTKKVGDLSNGFMFGFEENEAYISIHQEDFVNPHHEIIEDRYPTPTLWQDDGNFHLVTLTVDKDDFPFNAEVCIDGTSNCESENSNEAFSDEFDLPARPLTIGEDAQERTGSAFDLFPELSSAPTEFQIDDLCIWEDHLLTPSQINTLYNSGSGSACSTVTGGGGGGNGTSDFTTQMKTVVLSLGDFGNVAQNLLVNGSQTPTSYSIPIISSDPIVINTGTQDVFLEFTNYILQESPPDPSPQGGGGDGGGVPPDVPLVPPPGVGGGAAGRGPLTLDIKKDIFEELLGFSLFARLHQLQIGQAQDGTIDVTWNSPSDLTIDAIQVGDQFITWVGFPRSPFVVEGNDRISNGKIPYRIQPPNQLCDQVTGERINCVDRILYEIPIKIFGTVEGQKVEANTVIKANFSYDITLALLTIFVLFAAGVGAIIYRVAILPKEKEKDRKKLKFKRKEREVIESRFGANKSKLRRRP